jgi:DNA-binding transcriptional MerR regulator
MTSGLTQQPPLPLADLPDGRRASQRPADTKSPDAFRTISEVATDLGVPQHVLRFWESKFQQIQPLKRGGGRRYYRRKDVELINDIKDLLYNQGFTIRGVQKLLRENGRMPSARSMVVEPQIPNSLAASASSGTPAPVTALQPSPPRGLSPEKKRELENILSELKALRALLRQGGI